MKNRFVKDKNRSVLSSTEIKKFRQEITKHYINSVCKNGSTYNLISTGIYCMKKDGFTLPTF